MALKFIHAADYADIINAEELNVISGGVPANITSAERKAISKVKKYLLRKYDVDTLFAEIDDTDVGTVNDTRDITLVEYCIYFTLYILYTSIAKRNVPEDRYEQYKEAKDFFNDVKLDMITPGWPLLLNDEGDAESPGIRMWSGFSDEYYY